MHDLLDSMTSNFTKLWAPSCKSVSSDCASSGRSAQPCHKCGNLDPNCKFAPLNYDHHLPRRNLHLPNLPIMGVSRSKTWLRSPKHHGGQRSRSEDFPLPLSSGHTIQDMVLRSQHCGCQRGTSAWLCMAVSSEKWCWKVEKDTHWLHIDKCQYISKNTIPWQLMRLMMILFIWLNYLLFSNLSCSSFREDCPCTKCRLAQCPNSWQLPPQPDCELWKRAAAYTKKSKATATTVTEREKLLDPLVADTKRCPKNTLI